MRNGFKGFLSFFIKQQKRLFSRPAFIVLLCLVVLMSAALSLAGDDSGGMVYVGLATEDADPVALEIIDGLTSKSGMASYEKVSPEEGEAAVREGRLDAVWIFRSDFSGIVKRVAMDDSAYAPVKVIAGEDTPAGALAREQLYALIYPYMSEALYEGFNREELGLDGKQSWDVMDDYSLKDDIITYETLSGEIPRGDDDYLLDSLRGLLALCVMLCAFACVMYALKDTADGVYDFLPQRSRFFPLLSGVFAGALDAGVIACLALVLSGSRMNAADALGMLLYVTSVTVFTFFVGSLCSRREVLGTVLPMVIIVTAIICPVFINIYAPEPLRVLLPTYLYLQAYGNPVYFIHMLVYTVAVGALAYPVFCVRTKK